MSEAPVYLAADWPAPVRVRAFTSTRLGGVSQGPYAGFNLGEHVQDDPHAVARNRSILRESLSLPAEPRWLSQVHGTQVVNAATAALRTQADASYSLQAGVVCAVLTADCLPVFLCDRRGTRVGVVHAGWRGLAAGVIERSVQALQLPGSELLACLGPAIGPQAFEVGAEVRAAFVSQDSGTMQAFTPGEDGRFYADLYALARRRLRAQGVQSISGGDYCTVTDATRFFSYRREGLCGRMASLIWLTPD